MAHDEAFNPEKEASFWHAKDLTAD